jgi:hypothetical protein
VARTKVLVQQGEQVAHGHGGWLRYAIAGSPVLTYVRYAKLGGRLEPVEIYMERTDEAALTSDDLRRVPLGRIDAQANSRPDLVQMWLQQPGPDLRRAARTFQSHQTNRATEPVLEALRLPRSLPEPDLDATLDVPTANSRLPYPDEFFRQVAEVYTRLTPWTRAPACLIADANGVPVSTVHRWTKVARSRGYLAPTRQGKAG